MKLFQIIFLIVFFLSSSLFSNEIKVIELHSKSDNLITQNTNNENENDEEEIQAIDDLLFNNNDESVINENSNVNNSRGVSSSVMTESIFNKYILSDRTTNGSDIIICGKTVRILIFNDPETVMVGF